MSELKVNSIVDANSGNTTQINGMTPTADSLQGFRNRILNGDMVIDQRNDGASVTPTTDAQYGGPDRWSYYLSQASKFSVQRSTVAPTGFSNSILVTSLSSYAVTGNDYFGVIQKIEGFNFADLMWGTANAKTITVSFWARSSLTGTFGGAMTNNVFNRAYPFSYTISAADTWEYKTVTIPGDTTGTWVGSTNATGVILQFSLGAVSGRSGTAGAWAGSWFISSTGATSVVGTNGATFYITGVQLEAGSVATPFERRPFGTELALCQRYFMGWRGDASATGFPLIGTGQVVNATQAGIMISTPAALRATPTMAFSGTVTLADASSAVVTTGVTPIYAASNNSVWAVISASAGTFTVGRAAILYCNNATTNTFSLSAEL
jgi:hypothetical protein